MELCGVLEIMDVLTPGNNRRIGWNKPMHYRFGSFVPIFFVLILGIPGKSQRKVLLCFFSIQVGD